MIHEEFYNLIEEGKIRQALNLLLTHTKKEHPKIYTGLIIQAARYTILTDWFEAKILSCERYLTELIHLISALIVYLEEYNNR